MILLHFFFISTRSLARNSSCVYSLVLARYLTLNVEWAGIQCDNLQHTEIPQHIDAQDLRFIDDLVTVIFVSLIFLFCVCTNTGVPLCIHLLYCHLSVLTLIFQFSPVNNPLSKSLFCSICQIVNEHCHRCIFCLLLIWILYPILFFRKNLFRHLDVIHHQYQPLSNRPHQ